MANYACSLCGYVYDEASGTSWDALPEDWLCPLCGGAKDAFNKQKPPPNANTTGSEKAAPKHEDTESRKLTAGELSAIFSNLAKSCEKQDLMEESTLFKELAEYYKNTASPEEAPSLNAMADILKEDVEQRYPAAERAAKEELDRGALRAFTWGNKVSRIAGSLLGRYRKEGSGFIENSKVFVCEICGFIYVGEAKPEICPICKVPALKIQELKKGA